MSSAMTASVANASLVNAYALHDTADRAGVARWSVSALAIVAAHVALIAAGMAWVASAPPPGTMVPAIMVDLTPATSTPEPQQQDIAPGPEMQQAEEQAAPPPEPLQRQAIQEQIPATGVPVRMGRVLDGVAPHMGNYGERGFEQADAPEASEDEVVAMLKDSGAEILVNFLPVGSQQAVEFYMECALKAGVAVVNCMPVFIASRPEWERRFREKNLPIIGDDVKAQLGATIVHRVLSSLFRTRGVSYNRTYQLNTGGNTDFMNMLDRNRLESKKESKTDAVQSTLAEPLGADDIHIGPSDYIPG